MSLINIAEAARVAGCSDKTLRRAIDEGKLKAQPRKVPNHPIMVDVEDLQAYLAERRGVQVEVMEVKVSPLPVKEKPSRSGSDSALVDRITALEHLVEELQTDHRGDITEMNVMLSHAEEQMDTGLVARVTELERTIQQMQEEHESERLLGSGRDPLALGPMDDAYYQGRIDTLELDNSRLRGQVAGLEETIKDMLTRMDQLEKDEAHDIADLNRHIEKVDARAGARLDQDSKRITAIEAGAILLEQKMGAFTEHVNELIVSTRPAPRKRGKPEKNERGAFYESKEDRIIVRFQESNDAPYIPYETDSLETAESWVKQYLEDGTLPDTGTFELADFTQLLLPEYRSSATRGDMKAWFTLRPEPQGIEGDYSIAYFEMGRADGKRGQLKREQMDRGTQLKQDLRTKAVWSLIQAGWTKGPHDIFVCPKVRKS